MLIRCACGWEKQVKDELAGKKAQCPKCANTFVIVEAPLRGPEIDEDEALELMMGSPAVSISVPASRTLPDPVEPEPPLIIQQPNSPLRIGRFSDAKHANQAKALLLEGEVMLAVATGTVHEKSERSNGSFGMLQTDTNKGGLFHTHYLIVTDRRVILWARGMLRQSTDAFFHDEIRSVEVQKSILTAAIVFNIGRVECFGSVQKDLADKLVSFLRQHIATGREAKAQPQTPTVSVDIVSQLERLAALKSSGVLSDEEFLAAKQKLIG
ncbi:MAG: SHOCT domain-containing protein [Planctomycetaceae bacterium]|nr:SHOCT domain-containing protein [Planctomycetaceae bacterium]